jgi:hypothetical protein
MKGFSNVLYVLIFWVVVAEQPSFAKNKIENIFVDVLINKNREVIF